METVLPNHNVRVIPAPHNAEETLRLAAKQHERTGELVSPSLLFELLERRIKFNPCTLKEITDQHEGILFVANHYVDREIEWTNLIAFIAKALSYTNNHKPIRFIMQSADHFQLRANQISDILSSQNPLVYLSTIFQRGSMKRAVDAISELISDFPTLKMFGALPTDQEGREELRKILGEQDHYLFLFPEGTDSTVLGHPHPKVWKTLYTSLSAGFVIVPVGFYPSRKDMVMTFASPIGLPFFLSCIGKEITIATTKIPLLSGREKASISAIVLERIAKLLPYEYRGQYRYTAA